VIVITGYNIMVGSKLHSFYVLSAQATKVRWYILDIQ